MFIIKQFYFHMKYNTTVKVMNNIKCSIHRNEGICHLGLWKRVRMHCNWYHFQITIGIIFVISHNMISTLLSEQLTAQKHWFYTNTVASQILTTHCSVAYQQRKQQSSTLLALYLLIIIFNWIPSKRASKTESISLSWCHHVPLDSKVYGVVFVFKVCHVVVTASLYPILCYIQ